MTLDTLLTVALDIAFFSVFAFTLMEYLRSRDRVRLVVVLMFASLSIILALPLVRIVAPALATLLGVVTIPALLAQPVLVLWLASYVRPIPRWALRGAALAYVALATSLMVSLAGGGSAPSGASTLLMLTLVAYFLVLEGAAALGFALAARQRAGASRSRLVTAAIATAALGLALVVLVGGGLAFAPNSDAAAATTVIVRALALLSALGYLAAFAPPRALRRLSQQAIVYDFIRDLNALPTGTAVGEIWELLERTATRAAGAARVDVVMGAAAPAAASSSRLVSMPFRSTRWPDARLEVDLGEQSLFRDDDLELIGLLVDRATGAAEREAFIVERERLIADLQAASAAKSDFLAAMSHELRTPLNAIIGFSELLSEGGEEAADAATVQTYAEHIHGSGLHLLELVNDVLDLARVEAGRLDLKPTRFGLDSLVRQTVATMQPLADQKQLSVRVQLAPVAIEADPGRVRQIVLNLLSNAVKFTDARGDISITLETDGDDVRLLVSDTGRGIGKNDIGLIFDAFHQGSRSASHEGTGLGLALTRQLVEAHGGTISVTSKVGQGSTFTVRLPVKRSPLRPEMEPAPAFPAGKPGVLVIEDDPAARELLRVHLEGAGYGVVATDLGRQALAWLSQIRPDAVILDILLPDVDGWEILQRLKSEIATRSIPVMVVSVLDDRQLGLALGAVDYFVKPVSKELLLEGLGRLTFTTKVRTRTVTALVIDPDPAALGRYRQLLEPDGFKVIGAHDGATGRRRAIDDRPDLILLDALLPDIDGFELASSLHQDPATSAIPVWVTTPRELEPETRARLNGNVQGVFARGDEALDALRGWLETGNPATPATPSAGPAAPKPSATPSAAGQARAPGTTGASA
jgi:signal transduction histidine kinase/DNA-binding response OmpR family regulator